MTDTLTDHEFQLAGEAAIADPDGVLVLPGQRALIVSDLHFEKGSSFGMGGQMLPPYDTRTTLRLTDLVDSVTHWVWIEGNHDPAPPPHFGGEVRQTLALGTLLLRHEPTEGPAPGEIAGHLHPCAKVRGKGRSVRARCFATDGTRLIMPAFGAYTGGLNVCDPAFARCFGQIPDALVMGRSRIYPVAARSCVPDGR